MKAIKILFLFLLLIAVGVVMFKIGNAVPKKETPLPAPKVMGVSEVVVAGEEYSFTTIKVTDASRVKLLPNFLEQKTSEEIINEGRCKNLVNGGFYSEKFTPIGLFISEREEIQKRQINATFNGFFLVSEGNIPEILRETRDEEYRIGLQAGPILILNSTPLILKLKEEEQEKDRRVIVALNDKGETFFIVVFTQNSVFSGPTLASLPELLQEVQNSLGENFVSALNLDGGAASTFWGEGARLKELSPIGSYFCIN
ncbi:hypothetical protein A2V56_03240 [Candidatus Woesebacteria bacterium RBG_19FT_COMBO_42_9]|uniref:Phosphodiester glycosidase domain-containing protein n=1 Tax=Candidatus Woesebacteria bacterium RBG_16_42_24 TaxID=1802485 RepID=A0A1F7XM33_9BACT|nr:MAG: hypothetical protein A2V97_01865 [Candidatus Woesebacteria bacterium RBG_16_42_24]OGM16392.1 MAG: hypothetical protein A2V56_03240 [Candidatus Woesebacteria bacterium RBG_19FT_COMBO_42_9]OGM66404.1 MAG: hypothetical protein A2985_03695 [Candidatus Woesebacteria bacterium RIFCSPLOWO2_01_FULL_43_11]